MTDSLRDQIARTLAGHLPVEVPTGPREGRLMLCICDVTRTFDGPIEHRQHVAEALTALVAFPQLEGRPAVVEDYDGNEFTVDIDYVDQTVDGENVTLLRDLVYALWEALNPKDGQ